MSNEIKKLLKIPSMDKYLFYALDGDEVVEHNDYFEVKNTIIKVNGKFKTIKEMNLSGMKIYVNDIDYDDVLYADKEIELIYEAPDKNHSLKIKVNEIEFDQKDDKFYIFYISLNSKDVRAFFDEVLLSSINNKKIELLRLAEADDL